MSEARQAYRLEFTVHLGRDLGRDPATLPEHEVEELAALHLLDLCGSLFWVVHQLGREAEQSHWVQSHQDFCEALQLIGELGRDLAGAARDHAQRLEQLAERWRQRAGGEGGS